MAGEMTLVDVSGGRITEPEEGQRECAPIEGVPDYGPQWIAGQTCSTCAWVSEQTRRTRKGIGLIGARVSTKATGKVRYRCEMYSTAVGRFCWCDSWEPRGG